MNTETVLVLDFIREEQVGKVRETNLAEAGIRYQLTTLTILAAGAAAGIGEDSPTSERPWPFSIP